VIEEPRNHVTQLLREVARGNRDAEADLVPLVYAALRRIASRCMRAEREPRTLQTTALVHEAYIRLAGPQVRDWHDREHFFAVAATVMRRLLIDRARARLSDKRGGGWIRSDSFEGPASLADDPERMLALDQALGRLAALDARQCRIVELRYFTGMSIEETAHVLNVSPRTVKRDWQLAKAWLYGELTSEPARSARS